MTVGVRPLPRRVAHLGHFPIVDATPSVSPQGGNGALITCVTGPSCTGKTTLGRSLAHLTGLPFRSCGSAVRERATTLGVDITGLPDGEHRAVDDDTVEWARSHSPCIVEGRFLASVFQREDAFVTIVRLTASVAVRARRGRIRGISTFDEDDVRRTDAEDDEFQARLYRLPALRPPSFILDTTYLTVDECVRRVMAIVKGLGAPPV